MFMNMAFGTDISCPFYIRVVRVNGAIEKAAFEVSTFSYN